MSQVFLKVLNRHASVEGLGCVRVTEQVRVDPLANPGALGGVVNRLLNGPLAKRAVAATAAPVGKKDAVRTCLQRLRSAGVAEEPLGEPGVNRHHALPRTL